MALSNRRFPHFESFIFCRITARPQRHAVQL